MQNCKTCVHWKKANENQFIATEFLIPSHPTDFRDLTEQECKEMNIHEVRYCDSPEKLFYARPDKNGCAIVDGSNYQGELITGGDFGCVNHDPCA